ncbi:hypothetical protein EU245_15075, partial [Lentibacillus lipolyticus]
MKVEDSFVIRLRFKLMIHESNGQAFEDLFTKIMEKKYKNFLRVKAYGRIGDMKNDGFDKTKGVYYQIFGPENINKKQTISDATQKLKEDFQGLKKHWDSICPIQEFYFVINDKYQGIPAPITQEIIKIENDYKGVLCDEFTSSDLEDVLLSLPYEEIIDVVGYLPNADLDLLDYDILNEVVDFIMNSPADFSAEEKMVVPDFNEKIKFNDLNDQNNELHRRVNDMLIAGSYSEGFLEEYFRRNSEYIRNELRKKLNGFYLDSIEAIPKSEENYSVKRFYYILEKCCPIPTKSVQDTALALMAHYFESCDIFEEPNKV